MKIWKQTIAILAFAALMGGNAGTAIAGVAEGMAAYDKRDYGKAAIEFKKTAHNGDKIAQYSLGAMYSQGEGVNKDLKEAIAWYRKAAEQGHVNAQYNLGIMLHEGEGEAKNLEEALKWYRKAAEQGHVDAPYNVGVMLHQGEGVAKNLEEALKWYRKAAKLGSAAAQFNLGVMYETGEGDKKNKKNAKEAVTWYRKAAEQGYAAAQESLGLHYYHGIGVARDKVIAYALFNSAASEGVEDAVQHRNVVETELAPPQLEEAQSISSVLRGNGVLPKQSRTWLENSEKSNALKEPVRQAIQPQSTINRAAGNVIRITPNQPPNKRCPVNPMTNFPMPFQRCTGLDERGHLYMTCNPTLKHISPCNPRGQ